MTVLSKQVKSYWCHIYCGGDIQVAKQLLREECMREGLCVTVEPCEFIYTGGQESGFVVGFINYPRFPAGEVDIFLRAEVIARKLIDACCQHSVLVMDPYTNMWLYREEKLEGK